MKRAILQISDEILMDILKGLMTGPNRKFKVTENPLPKDVKIVRSYSVDRTVEIIVESEAFVEIEKSPYPVLSCPVVTVEFDK